MFHQCNCIFDAGIVIKFDGMDKDMALHHAHLVLSLYSKATKFTKDLFDPPDVSSFKSLRTYLRSYADIVTIYTRTRWSPFA